MPASSVSSQSSHQSGIHFYLQSGGRSTSHFDLSDHHERSLERKKRIHLLKVHNSSPLISSRSGSNTSLASINIASTAPPRNNNNINNQRDDTRKQMPRGVSFTSICFSQVMPQFSTTDQLGTVHLFDVRDCRYTCVARTGIPGTTISMGSTVRPHEIYVGLSDGTIQCFNSISCLSVARLLVSKKGKRPGSKRDGGGDSTPSQLVSHLSPHPSKPLLMSSSPYSVIVWDIAKWERRKALSGIKKATIVCSVFDPSGEHIVCTFSDCSIVVWSLDTFSPIWNLEMMSVDATVDISSVTTVRFSRDGCYMAGCVNSERTKLFIWDTSAKSLLKEINLDGHISNDSLVVDYLFVADSSIVLMLLSTGDIMFIDTANGNVLPRRKGDVRAAAIDVSQDGKYLLTLGETNADITLSRLDRILQIKSAESQDDLTPNAEKLLDGRYADNQKKESQENAEKQRAEHEEEQDRVETIAPKPHPKLHSASQRDIQKILDLNPSNVLTFAKLKEYATHFGEFPQRYRLLIWRFLFQVPENVEAFEALFKRGTHPTLKTFRHKYPMKSERVARSMETIMSCLAYWSPVFEGLDYLPSLVFPFVKNFPNDTFANFEMIMSLITNWCESWFEYFPNPPMKVLCIMEDLLAYHDRNLFEHLKKFKITSQLYAWPLFSSIFSDVMCRKDWLCLWDQILVNPPDYMYFAALAFIKQFRAPMFQIKDPKDMKHFMSQNATVNVKKLLKTAYELQQKTPVSVFGREARRFTPLLRGHYPIFNKYPEHIVNYQKKLRERIGYEEAEFLRKKQITSELAKIASVLKSEDRDSKKAESARREMLKNWWDSMLDEEESRLDKRVNMELLMNEKKLEALRELDRAEMQQEVMDEFNKLQNNPYMTKAHEGKADFVSSESKVTTSNDILDPGFRIIENLIEPRRNRLNMARRAESQRFDNQLRSILHRQ